MINFYASEKQDWSLNGCLWFGQDNTPKPNALKGYLSDKESTEENIPREFTKNNRKLVENNQCFIQKPSF